MKQFYNFDVNMTENCTLRCTYCIENFNKPKFKNIPTDVAEKISQKIDYLINDPQFLMKYGGVKISFWGGEPTTNLEGLKYFTNKYWNNDKVIFFMYSNGYKYDKIFDFLEQFKYKIINGEPKFFVQISYDGLASHDVDRLNIKGKGTALKVKETIFELARRSIPFSIHPTIAVKNFDKISDNYFEFKRMSEILNINLQYNPTIDYMSKYNFSEDDLKAIENTLIDQFKKIKNDEIEYFLKNHYFRFGWMNPSKAICHAGDGYSGIELDGKVYACHGVFNEPTIKDKLVLNDINFENMIFKEKLLKQSNYYNNLLEKKPKECENCFTHYCLKCNSTKCSISTKETFEEKWTDYTNQPSLCHIFKFLGKYRIALMRLINEKYKN